MSILYHRTTMKRMMAEATNSHSPEGSLSKWFKTTWWKSSRPINSRCIDHRELPIRVLSRTKDRWHQTMAILVSGNWIFNNLEISLYSKNRILNRNRPQMHFLMLIFSIWLESTGHLISSFLQMSIPLQTIQYKRKLK
jgi:hypothetical protein